MLCNMYSNNGTPRVFKYIHHWSSVTALFSAVKGQQAVYKKVLCNNTVSRNATVSAAEEFQKRWIMVSFRANDPSSRSQHRVESCFGN